MVYGKWHLQPNRVVPGQKREKKGEHWRKIKSIWNFQDPLQNPNCIIMQLQFIFLSSSRPISQLWIFCQIIQDPHWCFSILRQASFICAYNSAACSWTVASSWFFFFIEFRQDVVRGMRDFGWVQNQFNPSLGFFPPSPFLIILFFNFANESFRFCAQ